jgi:hypothetical protein
MVQDNAKWYDQSVTFNTKGSQWCRQCIPSKQYRSNPWARWVVHREPHEHRDSMLICVCCVRFDFLMIKDWFCWKYQYNTRYMFNLIKDYICIPVSGCVRRGPSALLYTGAMMLLRRRARVAQWVRSLDLTAHTSLSYTAWVRAQLCKLQKRVRSTRSRKW